MFKWPNPFIFFKPNNEVRSSAQLNVSYNLRNYGLRSFSVASPKLWNDMPLELRDCENLKSFKKKTQDLSFQKSVFITLVISFLILSCKERVQISASGHADADQSGADFFRFRFQSVPILSVPNETESATGQNSSSGQLTEVIKS